MDAVAGLEADTQILADLENDAGQVAVTAVEAGLVTELQAGQADPKGAVAPP